MADVEQPEGEPQSRHVTYCGGEFTSPSHDAKMRVETYLTVSPYSLHSAPRGNDPFTNQFRENPSN